MSAHPDDVPRKKTKKNLYATAVTHVPHQLHRQTLCEKAEERKQQEEIRLDGYRTKNAIRKQHVASSIDREVTRPLTLKDFAKNKTKNRPNSTLNWVTKKKPLEVRAYTRTRPKRTSTLELPPSTSVDVRRYTTSKRRRVSKLPSEDSVIEISDEDEANEVRSDGALSDSSDDMSDPLPSALPTASNPLSIISDKSRPYRRSSCKELEDRRQPRVDGFIKTGSDTQGFPDVIEMWFGLQKIEGVGTVLTDCNKEKITIKVHGEPVEIRIKDLSLFLVHTTSQPFRLVFQHKLDVKSATRFKELSQGNYDPKVVNTEDDFHHMRTCRLETGQWAKCSGEFWCKKVGKFSNLSEDKACEISSTAIAKYFNCGIEDQLPIRSTRLSSSRAADATTLPASESASQDVGLSQEELNRTLLVWPRSSSKSKWSFEIKVCDYNRLDEGEFLNDVIINFYLKYLELNKFSEEARVKIHIFTTFWHKKFTQGGKSSAKLEEGFAKVKNWTKNIDIFEKDFLVVPINEHAHWFLAIICYPGMSSEDIISHVTCPKCEEMFESDKSYKDHWREVHEHESTSDEEEEFISTSVKESSSVIIDTVNDCQFHDTNANVTSQAAQELFDEMIDKNTKDAASAKSETSVPIAECIAVDSDDEVDGVSKSATSGDDVLRRVENLNIENEHNTSKSKQDPILVDEHDSAKKSENSEASYAGKDSESTDEIQEVKKPKRVSKRRNIRRKKQQPPQGFKFCEKRPCILLFDSLGSKRQAAGNHLRQYLQFAWRHKMQQTKEKSDVTILDEESCKDFKDFPIIHVKSGQQDNFCDCGLYVLQYIVKFFGDGTRSDSVIDVWFNNSIQLEGCSVNEMKHKRQDLKKLIDDLASSDETDDSKLLSPEL